MKRARSVDVARVAHTASSILDEGGLRALTVRAVAQRLDIAPASLYSRFSSSDDLFDVALDDALGRDAELQSAVRRAPLDALMVAYFRHLVRRPWACQVIAMRAPRGPNYLLLSERMCVLLVERGSADPLGDAYALSNFVIGSATTAPIAGHERVAPVDPRLAPTYATLHAARPEDPEAVLTAGLTALLAAPGLRNACRR
ncbi:TetR/AcrR family transcriptional regulator [Gordonia shandongensis]|uniref:TetR/AcrR family transcriptional regulator n=1 Tax=Gordonia shandongensis TaxID=376351 RepID=UPI0003FAACD7|nr:TetR/AcrR family transcriptional regulator [Gordonia shandongensis]